MQTLSHNTPETLSPLQQSHDEWHMRPNLAPKFDKLQNLWNKSVSISVLVFFVSLAQAEMRVCWGKTWGLLGDTEY